MKLYQKGIVSKCLLQEADVKLKNDMREIKKFSLRNVSDRLPDSKLKKVLGGYSGWCYKCYTHTNACENGFASDCFSTYDLLEERCKFGFVCGPCDMIDLCEIVPKKD